MFIVIVGVLAFVVTFTPLNGVINDLLIPEDTINWIREHNITEDTIIISCDNGSKEYYINYSHYNNTIIRCGKLNYNFRAKQEPISFQLNFS